jgi:acetolactate synthase-1/2/3 large subunit
MVIIVLVDNGYGMIKWKQHSMGFAEHGLDFGNPDFVMLAQSFGATGHAIHSAEEFKPTLEAALSGTGVHIIALPIDYSENAATFGPLTTITEE